MEDQEPHPITDEVVCHRCGQIVTPTEEEPFVVNHGLTTCSKCLLFIEKNGIHLEIDVIYSFGSWDEI